MVQLEATRMRPPSARYDMSDTGEQWQPFTSTQRAITHRPGFLWNGRVSIFPGLIAHVHGSYIAGVGTLHAAMLGMFTSKRICSRRDTASVARSFDMSTGSIGATSIAGDELAHRLGVRGQYGAAGTKTGWAICIAPGVPVGSADQRRVIPGTSMSKPRSGDSKT